MKIIILFLLILSVLFIKQTKQKKQTKKIVTLNVGYYLLGGFIENGSSIMEIICKKILNKLSIYNPDIICTQEDLISDYPIFKDIYAEYGYRVVNFCVSHPKLSNDKYIREKYGLTKLGNVIYAKENITKYITIPDLDVGSSKGGCYIKPRCATSIIINNIIIFNTHLCGGRYDDKFVAQNKINSNSKEKQVMNILKYKPDIIIGDFNAGYTDDYKFAESLSKNLDKQNFKNWNESVIEFILKNGYKSALKNYKNEQTTIRGNFVVDWIFYNNNVNVSNTQIIKFYDSYEILPDTDEILSDHNALFTEIIF